MTVDDLCYWYKASRDQRTHEIERHLGLEGTMGYKERGCYNCSGLDVACEFYTILESNKKEKK